MLDPKDLISYSLAYCNCACYIIAAEEEFMNSLTKVSPDRCHSLTLGKAIDSQTAVPVSTTEQKLCIMRNNKQMTVERQTRMEGPRNLFSCPVQNNKQFQSLAVRFETFSNRNHHLCPIFLKFYFFSRMETGINHLHFLLSRKRFFLFFFFFPEIFFL